MSFGDKGFGTIGLDNKTQERIRGSINQSQKFSEKSLTGTGPLHRIKSPFPAATLSSRNQETPLPAQGPLNGSLNTLFEKLNDDKVIKAGSLFKI